MGKRLKIEYSAQKNVRHVWGGYCLAVHWQTWVRAFILLLQLVERLTQVGFGTGSLDRSLAFPFFRFPMPIARNGKTWLEKRPTGALSHWGLEKRDVGGIWTVCPDNSGNRRSACVQVARERRSLR